MNHKTNPIIANDILRYKKNSLASGLALAGLASGCLYFLILYAPINKNSYYYTWMIAFDVVYNLFFLLFTFLFSEQVKNYDSKLFPLQMLVGLFQFGRIFWLPLSGLNAGTIDVPPFVFMAIFLAISGALIIASGIIGLIRSRQVRAFVKQVENGTIDIDAELKKEDAFAAEADGGNKNA